MIRNASVAGPVRLTALLLFGLAGIAVGYLALSMTPEEKDWLAGIFRREQRPRRIAPRSTEIREDRATPAAPPRSRPAVAVAEPARSVVPGGRGANRKTASQPGLALGDSYVLPTIDLLARAPDKGKQQIDRAGLARNARLLQSVLR